jgi:benzoate membrane transport protein
MSRHAAIGAGIGATIFFAVAPLPLQVAVAADMGLDRAEASRWILVVWATGAAASIALSIRHRQPIVITSSVLGLIYLGSVAGDHSFAELVGANLVAGVAILALALMGVGERVMRLVPLPLVLAMFAGSVMQYVAGAAAATGDDPAIAGVAVLAYIAARAIGARRLPPVGVAAVAGTVAAVLAGRVGPVAHPWAEPSLSVPPIAFSPGAILTVSPVLVVFALALGNVQGLGHLQAQGYRVPVNAVSVAVGLASVVNGALGGHQASVARATSAMVAGPEAGRLEDRHIASVVASIGALLIAVGAATVVAVVAALPVALVAVITGLAVLPSFQDSLQRSLTGEGATGSVVAFVVAASPVDAAGIGSSTWALLAGVAVSLLGERSAKASPDPGTRSRVVALTTTSPGTPARASAAATSTAGPRAPATSPVWIPTRPPAAPIRPATSSPQRTARVGPSKRATPGAPATVPR